MRIQAFVDGERSATEVEPRMLLVEWLRSIGKTGTHVGCDTSSCGACTVLVGGRPTKSCTMFAVQADGAEIETIHGLTPDRGLSVVQQAFSDEHGLQCGFCTPGFIVSTEALLRETPQPGTAEIIEALEGNLCRCTGYVSIIRAVQRAAALLAGDEPEIVAGRGHAKPLATNEGSGRSASEDLSDTEVV